jgi:hypothetical protein
MIMVVNKPLGVDALTKVVAEVLGIVKLADEPGNRANPLARDDVEFEVLTALLRDAWVDRTYFDLASLARMSVPHLDGRLSELVAIRKSEDSFALWREALSRALAQLVRIPEDDEDWQHDATDIIYAELEPLRKQVIRKNARSDALSTLNKGVSAMLIAGAGVGLDGPQGAVYPRD